MYINPTLPFGLALLVFDEPLSEQKLLSFIIIWLALGLYSWSAWRGRKPLQPA
jgi:chloramphenicol-sensitive protein RarD